VQEIGESASFPVDRNSCGNIRWQGSDDLSRDHFEQRAVLLRLPAGRRVRLDVDSARVALKSLL
jgi:hypothetical protein